MMINGKHARIATFADQSNAGRSVGTPKDVTLIGLLQNKGIDTKRRAIAVAVNGAVVARSRWATTILDDRDRIEIVTAAAGG